MKFPELASLEERAEKRLFVRYPGYGRAALHGSPSRPERTVPGYIKYVRQSECQVYRAYQDEKEHIENAMPFTVDPEPFPNALYCVPSISPASYLGVADDRRILSHR